MDHEEEQGQDQEGGDAAHDEAHAARHGVEQTVAVCMEESKVEIPLHYGKKSVVCGSFPNKLFSGHSAGGTNQKRTSWKTAEEEGEIRARMCLDVWWWSFSL